MKMQIFLFVLIFNLYAMSALTQTINSITPNPVSAGTGDYVTIKGSGFGSNPGKISLKNADDPTNYFELPNNLYFSWSNSKIEFRLTTNIELNNQLITPGTGKIIIETQSGNQVQSSQELTITYALRRGKEGNNYLPVLMSNVNNNNGVTFHLSNAIENNASAKNAVLEAFDQWACSTGVNFNYGGSSSKSSMADDGINLIYLGNVNSSDHLGQTRVLETKCGQAEDPGWTNRAIPKDIDIKIVSLNNNQNRSWMYDPLQDKPLDQHDPVQGNEFDFYNIFLHELGHASMLEHINDDNELMYYIAQKGYTAPSFRNIVLKNQTLQGGKHLMSNSINAVDSACIMNCRCLDCENYISGIKFLTTKNQNFNIYPNPTEDRLHIEAKENTKDLVIEVYNIYGQQIEKINAGTVSYHNHISISLSSLTPGSYIIKGINQRNGQIFTDKIIKM